MSKISFRYTAILLLFMTCSSCGLFKMSHYSKHEAEMLPVNEVALLERYSKEGSFIQRWMSIVYIDGEEATWRGSYYSDKFKILPGFHTIGVFSTLGILGEISECYAGIVLKAEAGKAYDYYLDKDQDEANLIVIDETGKAVAKALCEPYSPFSREASSLIKSIHERIEIEKSELKSK